MNQHCTYPWRRLARRMNFVRWNQTFLGPQYETASSHVSGAKKTEVAQNYLENLFPLVRTLKNNLRSSAGKFYRRLFQQSKPQRNKALSTPDALRPVERLQRVLLTWPAIGEIPSIRVPSYDTPITSPHGCHACSRSLLKVIR